MPAIYPVAATRVSDLLIQQRLLSQFEYDRQQLVSLQDQLSTGLRINAPSEDAPAAGRAITLQRVLEQKQQAIVNVNTTTSYIAATDNALANVSELLTNIRAQALSAVDSTTSQTQRDVLSEEIRRAVDRLSEIGNSRFRGRYLFAGSQSREAPFQFRGEHIVYKGNEIDLRSLVDIDYLLDANVTGDEVFGAISPEVRGTVDLNPILTLDSKLRDLREGLGVTKGSFLISDSFTTKTVDISSAETVRDVVRIIEDNAPDGRQVTVRLSNRGLLIEIDDPGGGNLTVREVAGGTTAQELGIFNSDGVGVGQLVGKDLQPLLLPTTPLRNLLGTRASGLLEPVGLNNDIFIEAVDNGNEFNGVQVQLINSGAAGDTASATYDSATKTLEIDINPNITTALTLVNAINDTGLFNAQLDDKQGGTNDGSGVIPLGATATLAAGSGIVFDQQSGIRIVNGGKTFTINIDEAETFQDLLNLLNASEADVLAGISSDGRSLDVRSRLSGADFQIGENGGMTATQLGIRTMTRDTLLSDLNYGRGVDLTGGNDELVGDVNFVGLSGPHVDFVIAGNDGVEFDVDIRTAVTVGDVLDLINNAPANAGVTAQLAEIGNGIELADIDPLGVDSLTITRGDSFAAWDLGLLGRGEESATGEQHSFVVIAFPPPNDQGTAIEVTSVAPGIQFDDIEIEYRDGLSGDVAVAQFNTVLGRLFVDIDTSQTTANTIIAAIQAEGTFTAELDFTTDPTNDGKGIVGTTGIVGVTAGANPERIAGTDVNPLETKGIFNSLLRLNDALVDFDLPAIERAVAMFDDDFDRLTFMRGEIGARERSLGALTERVENEDVELRATLSTEIDADFVEAISNLTARQANMEATLRLLGQTLQLSVLNFL
jgi:flagellin-like hook-associated protein FlgL